MDINKILNYIKETPTNTNPAILLDFLSEASGEGGGNLDISIASVAFKTVDSGNYSVMIPTPTENDGFTIKIIYSNNYTSLTLPLYKGKATIPFECFQNLDGSVMPTTNGDITIGEDGIIITGDGSFTAKGTAGSSI